MENYEVKGIYCWTVESIPKNTFKTCISIWSVLKEEEDDDTTKGIDDGLMDKFMCPLRTYKKKKKTPPKEKCSPNVLYNKIILKKTMTPLKELIMD